MRGGLGSLLIPWCGGPRSLWIHWHGGPGSSWVGILDPSGSIGMVGPDPMGWWLLVLLDPFAWWTRVPWDPIRFFRVVALHPSGFPCLEAPESPGSSPSSPGSPGAPGCPHSSPGALCHGTGGAEAAAGTVPHITVCCVANPHSRELAKQEVLRLVQIFLGLVCVFLLLNICLPRLPARGQSWGGCGVHLRPGGELGQPLEN